MNDNMFFGGRRTVGGNGVSYFCNRTCLSILVFYIELGEVGSEYLHLLNCPFDLFKLDSDGTKFNSQ